MLYEMTFVCGILQYPWSTWFEMKKQSSAAVTIPRGVTLRFLVGCAMLVHQSRKYEIQLPYQIKSFITSGPEAANDFLSTRPGLSETIRCVAPWSTLAQIMAYHLLTHWGQDKMVDIFQMTFSNGLSSLKIVVFWFKFHWNMFPRAQLTIIQH